MSAANILKISDDQNEKENVAIHVTLRVHTIKYFFIFFFESNQIINKYRMENMSLTPNFVENRRKLF